MIYDEQCSGDDDVILPDDGSLDVCVPDIRSFSPFPTTLLVLYCALRTTFEMWPFPRGTNKDIHNYMNTMSLLAGLGGLGMAIDYNKWAPIKSVHAVVGYFAMGLMVLNFAGGFTM